MKFQYATKSGALKEFEAADQTAGLKMIQTFADADPSSGIMKADLGVAPVVQNGTVDISKVTPDVKPFVEPATTLSVVKTVDNPDGTTTNFLSNGQADTGSYTKNADGTLTFNPIDKVGFQDVPFNQLEPEDQLSRTASTIQKEISDIEKRMATSGERRNDALGEAGVFDDLRTLNSLKAELRSAEDRDIEIPIEARQKLRGQQATKTEFASETRPQLENNLLRTLAASRNVSRMTDTINTNIAVIDQRIKAETARDEFLYQQKQKRLETITKVYGDIITEKQKAALEAKKFENELTLEGIRSNNSLRNDLIKDIAKKGIGGTQLQGIMSASVDELLKFSAQLSAPVNWSGMTMEQAALTLDEDDFKRFTALKDWEAEQKKIEQEEDKEKKEQLTAGLATQQSAKGIISTIDSMLNDKEGLKNSVGVGFLGNRDINLFGLGVESTKFRALAKSLVSQNTLQVLKDLKSSGATLGAISEKELEILASAGTALNGKLDDKGNQTGRFNMKEADFEEALKTMRVASMKTFIAASIGKEAYARAGYLNADEKTIQTRYDDLLKNPGQNFYSEDKKDPALSSAFNQIKQEEGLRTEAYQDITGKWTIGFGNTTINGRPVQPGDRLTPTQAEALMQKSIVENYTTFARAIQTPINPQKFAALTSFEYNLGPAVWKSPTGQQILAKINTADYRGAGQLMLQYNRAKNPQTGQLEINPVLARRRMREANLLIS